MFAQEGTAGVLVAFSFLRVEVLVMFLSLISAVMSSVQLSAVVCGCGFGQLFPMSFHVAAFVLRHICVK